MTFKEWYILENKKQARDLVATARLKPEELTSLLAADPTSQKKYVGWMAKQWSNKSITDMDKLINTVKKFNSFAERKKTLKTDINQYATFNDLKKEVEKLNLTGDNISVGELERDFLDFTRENKGLIIMMPQTHEASRKLGLSTFAYRDCKDEKGNIKNKDSAWCTTYAAPDHFNDYYYKQDVSFLYIKVNDSPKGQLIKTNLKDKNFADKYTVVAIAVRPDGKMVAYDAEDSRFTGNILNNYLKIIGINLQKNPADGNLTLTYIP